jgi:molybdopterin-guanine dinucleotide biosynthesis protein A
VRAPIAGIIAGLRAASHDVAVMLPVDVPAITADALHALAAVCRDAAVPQTGPLPGAYRRTVLPVLERALADRRLALYAVLDELDVVTVPLDASVLTNVNTPDDLQRL